MNSLALEIRIVERRENWAVLRAKGKKTTTRIERYQQPC